MHGVTNYTMAGGCLLMMNWGNFVVFLSISVPDPKIRGVLKNWLEIVVLISISMVSKNVHKIGLFVNISILGGKSMVLK